MHNDPTPRSLRRSAAQEFGESWQSPSVQKYLGADFGRTPGSPAAPASVRDGGGTGTIGAGLSADARLQQTLAAIKRKDERLAAAGALGTIGSAGSAAGSGHVGTAGSHCIPAYQPPPMADSLAVDYRAQLQRYVQQLTAKDGEAASLRLQVSDLKAQLAAAEGRAAQAADQVARNAATAGQLEQAAAALERQLQEREQELAAAQQQKRAAEQVAAAAKAQAAAVQKSVSSKAAEFEKDRRYFKEQLERKDAELHSLEDALKNQAVELDRRAREWAQREAELSATHTRSHGATAAACAELGVAQEKLEAEAKRCRALEASNGELRRQKAQLAADMRMLEELLGDSDAERRDLHDKYVKLGERMEALVKEGKILKSSASSETSAARTAVQEAVKDAEAAIRERAALVARVQQLQEQLAEEQGSRNQLKDKVQRKLAAADQEVSLLRGELDSKAKQLQGLQADMKALQKDAEGKLGTCEKQMVALKDRMSTLKQEVEQEKQQASKAKANAEALYSERVKVELQQQALKYERRIQELEVACLHGGSAVAVCPGSPGPRLGGSVLDYIPRAEHVRLLEARLAAKEADMQLELGSRVAQVEREWQWKLEGKEQEISSLTARTRQLEDDLHTERQRASSQAHKLGDEGRRLAAQCVELQRELEAQAKEVARLKELLKDVRSANADMDDDAMTSNRQVARLRHALEGSQQALKEAQEALGQERKRCEEVQREAEAQAGQAVDAGRRADRLAAEVGELQVVLEQKQELITALQAESDAWSAKLMGHREHHEQEVEAIRRQLREEAAEKVAMLEQQCLVQATELQEVRQQHEEILGQLGQQHAVQVAQLEMQLAAAERCSSELRQVTTALGAVKQEDVETLKEAVQELQLRLKDSLRERERLQKQHAGQLAALSGQVQAKMAAFRAQHAQLKQQVESDVSAACSDCLASYEAGLAALQQRLEQQAAAAAGREAELAGQVAWLRQSLRQLVAALRAEVPLLPQAAEQVLAEGISSCSQREQQQQVAVAVQQVVQAVQQHVEQAEALAIDSALAALESSLLSERPGSSPTSSSAARSPPKLLSPSKRKQQQAEAAAVTTGQQAPSLEANEGRLAALLGRSRELLEQLAAGEAQVAQLQQQVASLESAVSGYSDQFRQAKAESIQAAEAARSAAVEPLKAEVARLTERVQGLKQLHASEMAAIEASARQQAAAAQAEAQAAIDRLAASGSSLQQRLRGETERAEGLAADLARMQDELAKHTQRAASKIEVQERELDMLKGRIREMEARDAANLAELRAVRQREREAALSSGGAGAGSSGAAGGLQGSRHLQQP